MPFIQKAFQMKEDGDLILVDQNIIDSQKGVMGDILKQATFLFFKGEGMVKLSLPIKIFDPISQLEKICNIFSNMKFMDQALETQNKLHRLQNIIVFIITGVYHSITMKKPFNPYLGETI